ncbi:HNH endonuclease signature motif containing protein [Marmoricola sp. URHB0036]|uniref:HNH endonuclease signature motif containing protein n=1 Tax=Marmoricola sp. URHB0036 TaxID=1298863 RepID=UPI000410CF1E|nr:HNH endonuclease signature motif containing protein [Marmoricola sp. URHB0036]
MDTTTLTAAEVIDGVRQARDDEHTAALRQVEFAVHWALIHPCRDEFPAGWEDEHGIFATTPTAPLAGAGAPLVDEFAPASFAAALGISLEAAKQRMADALELTYRLPRLLDLVQRGVVPVWRARAISRETHDLSPEAVAFADRLISATPSKIGLVDAARLVQEARLYFDPDRAVADEEEELARRGVWLRHRGNPATTDVVMTLDTPDALLFDQTVGRIAGELRELGDTEPVDVRRARAVGILADPQYALDLMSGRDAAPGPGSVLGAVNLYVHLDPDQPGAVSIEKLGAATDQLLTEWLTRYAAAGGKVIVRPVLDRSSTQAVDQHDPPSAMRELCTLRDAYCVFPGCIRDSRSCDLDHITAYIPMSDGGPPGQTNPLNLAPLCRTHHRMKTFTAWDYKRRDDGTHIWTSPTGHQYEVPRISRRPPRRTN